ncbi:hypothetical protein ACJX0J_039930, partial [Zea mays]
FYFVYISIVFMLNNFVFVYLVILYDLSPVIMVIIMPSEISMEEDRRWMYEGWKKRGALSSEWVAKTDAFLDRAFARSETGTDMLDDYMYQSKKFVEVENDDGLTELRYMPLIPRQTHEVAQRRGTAECPLR